MNPAYGAALIKTGGALLGGMIGNGRTTGGQLREQRRVKMQELRQTPTNIRVGAERAGFNPLVFAGPMSPGGYQATPGIGMGDAVSRAAMAFGDGLDRAEQTKIQLAQLEQENERLSQMAERLKLDANVPGIYGPRSGNRQAPNNGQAQPSQSTRRPMGQESETEVVDNSEFHKLTQPISPDRRLKFNKDELPKVRMWGLDWQGSGAMSTGATFEDALGESEVVSTIMAPLVGADMVGGTVRRQHMEANNDRLVDEWSYRSKNKLPTTEPLPRGWRDSDLSAKELERRNKIAREKAMESTPYGMGSYRNYINSQKGK